MSKNPYAQVALTYLRRPFATWKSGIVFVSLLLWLPLGVLIAGRTGNRIEFNPQQLVAFAFLFLCFVVHLKDQFVDSRAHLMPGFREVHARVAIPIAVVLVVFLPGLFTVLFGWHSVGFVAVIVLLFGTILWMLLSLSSWFTWIALVGWLLVCVEWARGSAQQLVSGGRESQAAAILAVGAVVTVLGGIRLFRLTEDMPEYRRVKWDSVDGSFKAVNQAPAAENAVTRGLSSWIDEQGIARLARHARCASTSWWSRVCRWQVGMMSGWSLFFVIAIGLFSVHTVHWGLTLLVQPPPQPPNTMPKTLGMVSFILILFPIFMTLGAFVKRLPSLTREVLMPVDRENYVAQLGAAIAISQVQLWGAAGIALVAWVLLITPQPVPSLMITEVLAVSAAIQVAAFGIIAWTSRRGSKWLCFWASGVLYLVAMVLQARLTSFPGVPDDVLWIAGGLAVLGLLVTLDAYRRWLVADFD